MEIYIKQY